ncbi:zf-DHHC-domain-containing protein [Backusella circina FSU 941]|nr:zf-DHHC-domain-containing protein [Backusella circina FSU 941]
MHIIGRSNVKRILGCWHYCCQSRNPFLQMFFVSLSSISIIGFLKFALPHLPGPYLHHIHFVIIPLQIIWIYVAYYIACTADPGIITQENVKRHLEYYKYDGLIYRPKQCTTCHLQKPARSKHCSMCKACVGRLDHHCAWINRCVGENNMRYFFMFLFTLTQFCAYGAYLCFQAYRGMIIEWGLDQVVEVDEVTGEERALGFYKSFMYVLDHDRIIGAIGILASVVSCVVLIFTIYQLYIVSQGVTTNEAFKWELLEESIYRGEIWKVTPKEQGTSSSVNIQPKEQEQVRRQVTSMDEIKNIYDLGRLGNLKEVFFPPRF